MPIYEYKCDRCDQVFEVRQKFSDEPLTTHEGCGGPVHRLLSAPAFQFKGSGWYITDYGRASGGKEPKSESKTESKGDSKTESKTESKTDSKTDASGSKASDTTAKKSSSETPTTKP